MSLGTRLNLFDIILDKYKFIYFIKVTGRKQKVIKIPQISEVYMKIKSGILFILLILILLCSNIVYAEDPGEPDTVRFEQWGTYVPCPPCSGIAVVPVVVFSDEELIGLGIPVRVSGPAVFDSGKFVGEVTQHFENPDEFGYILTLDEGKIMYIQLGFHPSNETVPPLYGPLAHLFLTVNDTGQASIYETSLAPGTVLLFLDTAWNSITPVFLNSEFYIGPQDVSPGDIDGNGIINLSDAIALANYFVKGGPPPVFSGSADVNTDCQIDFSDIILIAKWYFTAQIPLQPGCAY